MEVRLTLEAHADVADALEWYEAQAPHVVSRFIDEYRALLAQLGRNPRLYPVVRASVRRAGFSDFPYGLFFRIGSDSVEVFGCIHAKRDPRRWQRRSQ
jgi:toxin ParE1/3/4